MLYPTFHFSLLYRLNGGPLWNHLTLALSPNGTWRCSQPVSSQDGGWLVPLNPWPPHFPLWIINWLSLAVNSFGNSSFFANVAPVCLRLCNFGTIRATAARNPFLSLARKYKGTFLYNESPFSFSFECYDPLFISLGFAG